MANLRRLGIYGENLPTKEAKTVSAADFLIAGIVGKFERKYDKAIAVKDLTEFQARFGKHIFSTYYGWDAVKGFFSNVVGVNATLYVSSHVGYTGSAIDAVVASAQLDDQQGSPAKVLKLEAAYGDDLEYGVSGNRTGYTITPGNRFSTLAAATAISSARTITLDSVADIKVGDIVQINLTGSSPKSVYHKITEVNESAKTITWTDADLDSGGSSTLVLDDVVNVLGFRLRVWRKDEKGIVTEVDTELGKVYCTTESAVTDYYVQNVFNGNSKWIKVTRLSTTPTDIEDTLPATVSTVAYLASGADGTAPTTSAHWSRALSRLDDLPVRMICNPETTTDTIQQAGETYCKARNDNPKWIFNIPINQTKANLIKIGNNFQRSDDVLGVIVAQWVGVEDTFATSGLAPAREIPNVGHVMGLWIRSIGLNGIHFVPALKSMPIYGIKSIVGTQFLSDIDRTDLANAGINCIQEMTGYGFVVRNFFTPSTATAFRFANGILMREFIKISAIDSLQSSENTPNSLNRIKSDKSALLLFLYDLWERGSTGNVIKGETFGQTIDSSQNETKPTDHFEVIADLTNNPQSKINLGERNIDIYFTYPTPAGSIKIGTGFILK